MTTDTKCVYSMRCDNLHGKPILLRIRKYDAKIKEITVKYAEKHNIYRKLCLLFLIVIINVFSLMFEILSTKYSVAIFLIVSFYIYGIVFAIKLEKILIVQSLGYQIEVRYTLGRTVRFIAWQNVKSSFINEVIFRQQVIFMLSLLTKEDTAKEDIIPLFSGTMPRLNSLEVIYQHINDCHNS